ncbi:MAG: hypothetical protein E4G99_00595 [Anaerolineales bacterium]|nr:MAG: hypothetical protein E4G99_00595 [Anaerolineales bacterium]
MIMPRTATFLLLFAICIVLVGCGGQDQTMEVVPTDVEPTETVAITKIILDLPGDDVTSVTYSPDGAWLVTGAWDSGTDTAVFDEIRIWDASDGEQLLSFSERGEPVLSVAFSPDGRWLAAGLVDNSDNVVLWDVTTEKMAAVLEGHATWVTSVAFSPDSRLLASGSDDTLGSPAVKLWDVATFELITTLENVTYDVNSVAFSPDGRYLAAGQDDGVIQIWDLTTFEVVATLNGDAGDVFSLAFSPDGSLLATGVLFATVQVWDVQEEKVLWTQDHGSYARSVAFSSDGRLLAAGLEDGMVLVWDSMSHELISTLEVHQQRVNSVAFSPAGDRLASGSDDNTVVLWPVQEFHLGVVSLPELPAATAAPVIRPTSTSEVISNVRFDAFDVPMLPIPGGNYLIGGRPEQSLEICLKYRDDCLLEWFTDESPIHEVAIDEFMIDQFEVSNARFAECVEAGVCEPPDLASSATRPFYYGNPRFDDYPVIYASWEDANSYCQWRGARLPTEAEWETAARGGREPYPWGSSEPVCAANSPYGAKFDDEGSCNDTDTEAVGTYRPNAYELYDMAGNVMEWTADWYDAYPGGPSSNEYGEIYRVARGGSWYTFGYALRAHIRFPVIPSASFDHYGIRCASAPFESFGSAPQPPANGQEQLQDEWRPAISNAILLSTTCQLMFETHFKYSEGEIDLTRAKSELTTEGDFVGFAVRGFSSGPVPSLAVAPYILELEQQTNTLAYLLPPKNDSLIGSAQTLDTLGGICGSLNNLMTEIVHTSMAAGLSEASVDEIDQEMTPMINDLYDTVMGGS